MATSQRYANMQPRKHLNWLEVPPLMGFPLYYKCVVFHSMQAFAVSYVLTSRPLLLPAASRQASPDVLARAGPPPHNHAHQGAGWSPHQEQHFSQGAPPQQQQHQSPPPQQQQQQLQQQSPQRPQPPPQHINPDGVGRGVAVEITVSRLPCLGSPASGYAGARSPTCFTTYRSGIGPRERLLCAPTKQAST